MSDVSPPNRSRSRSTENVKWRVVMQRTLRASDGSIDLRDAEAQEASFPRFSSNGTWFDSHGVIVTTTPDAAVRVEVGIGQGPPRGEQVAEGVIHVGSAGLEVGMAPVGGIEILDWPAGMTRVAVFAPPGNPFQRRQVTIALTPLDAPPPQAEELQTRIDRLAAQLGTLGAQLAAVESLGRIGAPAVGRLVAILRDPSQSIEARFGAACALGKIGGTEVIDPLVEALSDVHPHVRRGAATGFDYLPQRAGDERVVAALTQALQDHEDQVDELAASALSKLGNSQTVPALIALLNGPNPGAADAALYALGALGDESVLPLIEAVLSGQHGRDFGVLTPNVQLAARRAQQAIAARQTGQSAKDQR